MAHYILIRAINAGVEITRKEELEYLVRGHLRRTESFISFRDWTLPDVVIIVIIHPFLPYHRNPFLTRVNAIIVKILGREKERA